MIIKLTRLIRDLRRRKGVGLGAIFSVVVVSLMGNALTFYLFDGGAAGGPGIGDALWYSIISITTIGYGEFAAESLGARIGTAVFIVIVGLAAFTTAIGMGVDWILELQYKERSGMGSPRVKDHLLIVNFPNERRVRQIIAEFLHDPNHRKREVVIVTDQLESLPFSLPRVHFVRGSVLEEETYQRANVSQAHLAIVLSIGYDVSSSDSVAASVVSILEYMNPELASVAECLNSDHTVLFKGSNNVSLVYTFRMSNNLIVQEAQDPGVGMLAHAITSNQIRGTLISTVVGDNLDASPGYGVVAKKLLDHGLNLVGVIKDDDIHVMFSDLDLSPQDRLVYVSAERHDWNAIRSFLRE